MISREEQRKAAKERIKKNYDEKDLGNFAGKPVLDFSKIGGYSKELFYKPTSGNNKIEILPYIVKTNKHPNGVKKGYPDYVLDIWVHRMVGPSESQYLCLQKTFGQPCPICEERDELRKDPDVDEKEIKSLLPKRRCWYNVINLDLPEKKQKIQLFEESHFLFEKEILEEAANGKDGFEPFFDIEDGSAIEFRVSEETSPMGKYFKYKRIDFVEREPYDEEIYEETYPLDELLYIPTYEEVRNAFHGIGAIEEPEDDEPEKDDEEEEAPRRTRGRRKAEEPKNEPESEEEPEEAPPKRTRGRKKAKEPNEGEKKPETKPKGNSCPFGHKFGKDNDEYQECSECAAEIWEKCADARDEMDE